jgi:hypothetical protein
MNLRSGKKAMHSCCGGPPDLAGQLSTRKTLLVHMFIVNTHYRPDG